MKSFFIMFAFLVLSSNAMASEVTMQVRPVTNSSHEILWNNCLECKTYDLKVTEMVSGKSWVITNITSPYTLTGISAKSAHSLQIISFKEGENVLSNVLTMSPTGIPDICYTKIPKCFFALHNDHSVVTKESSISLASNGGFCHHQSFFLNVSGLEGVSITAFTLQEPGPSRIVLRGSRAIFVPATGTFKQEEHLFMETFKKELRFNFKLSTGEDQVFTARCALE